MDRKSIMKIGNKEFDIAHGFYVMGILNVTPDSFSDGGRWNRTDLALAHAGRMIEEGAAIIDVGGESTRPGYRQISEEEELSRILPVLEALKKEYDIPLSVDTYKSRVAKAAIEAGADLVNDIRGLKYDSAMGRVIAEGNAACCLMHNRRMPLDGSPAEYVDFKKDLLSELEESLTLAREAGIPKDRIIIDPGVGFAKSTEQNLTIMGSLSELRQLGCPILLGASRKSVIGKTLDLPEEERLEGTLATTVLGLQQGVSFFRVHDVKENYRALKMAQAVLNAGQKETR